MKKNKSFKEKINNFLKEWWGIIFIAFIAMLTIFIFGYFYFSKHSLSWLSGEVEELGQMGDFFGGTLNPILAFLSFCLLLITIKLQSKELKNSTEELAKSSKALTEQSKSLKIQNFETTFFNMLSLHNEILKNIVIKDNPSFRYRRVNQKNEFNIIKFEEKPSNNDISGKIAIKEIVQGIEGISNSIIYPPRTFFNLYNLIYNTIQPYIGHYFVNIFQILKFISTDETISDKKKYSNLFRAQFSSNELKLLFYHCAGKIGSEKFKDYIAEFNFFEHLIVEKENYIFKFIISNYLYSDCAFGDEKNKFNNFAQNILYENKECFEDIKNGRYFHQYELIRKCYESNNYILAKENIQNLPIIMHQGNIEVIIKEVEDEINKSNSSSQEPQ
ncbi:putative phage abortive infection protein [Aliarcobacter butzleri]|uniref:putative phage abortive infection protein n=1 Tax=Aliarcobacter butzleri TaxID=28197 RepID=UPI001EE09075|nr:putative phage abortive infection protein [Aliarcobacter butzleri]MCG3698861.1 putative phage abortive infection protein [Aliarcobacter butzleri]